VLLQARGDVDNNQSIKHQFLIAFDISLVDRNHTSYTRQSTSPTQAVIDLFRSQHQNQHQRATKSTDQSIPDLRQQGCDKCQSRDEIITFYKNENARLRNERDDMGKEINDQKQEFEQRIEILKEQRRELEQQVNRLIGQISALQRDQWRRGWFA